MILRWQLPAYSPITLGAIGRSVVHAVGSRELTEQLEGELRRDYGADTVGLYGSGTQALQAALRVALDRVGDSAVALPAFTCFDVASAAVALGARIALYDVDPNTLAPDLESLRRVVERWGARAVVITPLFGYPIAWDGIDAVLEPLGAVAIEDAAQGHGAEWQGRAVGSFGAISVLSFGRGKGWTGGTGGALLLRGDAASSLPKDRSDHLPRRADEGGNLLALAAQWMFGRPGLYGLPAAIPWLKLGETVYRDAVPPHGMARGASACIMATRTLLQREVATRRANAQELIAEMGGDSRLRPIRLPPGSMPSYLRLPVRVRGGLAGLTDPAGARRLGIAPGYPGTLAELAPVRARMDASNGGWSGAELLVRTLVTIPTHSLLSATDRRRLVDAVLD